MREIKFRGRYVGMDSPYVESKVKKGDIVYGGYNRYDGEFLKGEAILVDGYGYMVESVQQLIAVDKNGKEVYENDLISGGKSATFEDYSAIIHGQAVLEAAHETN